MDWVALDFPSIDATPGLRLIYSHLEKKFAERKTLLTRQMPYEPLPASVLFGLGGAIRRPM